ncbi:hypothetical protein M405DRAFT_825768 [Rhizopogon salebrosus TDB-379]|nr:hypothetical protein M405DRAFT_825768 [Rhizopogon salebrosus TDB-379]
MSEFPPEGTYRISYQSFTATVLDGQNILRGEPIRDDIYRWDLVYVHDSSGLVKCALRDRQGQGYLRVNSVENYEEVLLSGPQEWILQKTDDGYTISQIGGEDVQYFWYLSGNGQPIRIVHGSQGIQSWVFEQQPEN